MNWGGGGTSTNIYYRNRMFILAGIFKSLFLCLCFTVDSLHAVGAGSIQLVWSLPSRQKNSMAPNCCFPSWGSRMRLQIHNAEGTATSTGLLPPQKPPLPGLDPAEMF